jgi:CPA2 family monovalent cation:H+ antiporter-2
MAETLLVGASIVLLALAVVGGLAGRIGQSVIPAYIVVGVLLGPYAPAVGGYSLSVLPSPEPLRLLAELGVVLLLFFVGLELSLDQLVTNRRKFLAAGAIDIGISGPLGLLLGLAVGFSLVESLFLALIVFNSSTVIIAKSLLDTGWVANPEGDAILGVVVIEDVVTALAFAVLSTVVLAGADVEQAARSVAVSLGFLVAIALVAYYGAAILEDLFETPSTELFVLGVVGTAALVGGLGFIGGISEAVAAFLAGTAFGRTSLSDRVAQHLTPLRDIAAAVFFFLVGASTDPRLLAAVVGLVAVAAVVTLAGQLVSGYLAGRAYGLPTERAVRVGCALAPRGEFSLVIAAFLTAAGTTPVLSETLPAFTVGYVLVTSIVGSVLIRSADRVGEAVFGRSIGSG